MKRVLLVEDVPQVAEHLRSMLAREKEVQLTGVHASADDALKQAAAEKPDVLMVDALLQGKVSGPDVARRVRAASPATRIVMITVPQRPIEPAADDAIDAVLVLPGGANELADALGGTGKATRDGKGSMVAVYSPQGGAGRTTIAVNLACALRRRGSTVALFDGVMQFGSVRHLLPVPASARSLVDLPAGAAMRGSIGEVVWEGPGGVDMLLAPPRPEEADLVAAAEVAHAMELLADDHEYVVIDCAARMSDDTLAILDAASVVLMVVTTAPASVANARLAIEVFDALGYRGHKSVLLVISETGGAGGLDRAEIEHALGLPVVAEIPADAVMVSAASKALRPFVLSDPDAQLSQAIDGLATALVTQHRR